MVNIRRRAFLAGGLAQAACHGAPSMTDVPGRWLRWGGRWWMVRDGTTPADPGMNRWARSRSAIARRGAALELTTRTEVSGPWGVELWTPLALHEQVTLSVLPHAGGLHPQDVLGMFLFEDGRCEIDIELARWGNPSGPDVLHSGPDLSAAGALDCDRASSHHTLSVTPNTVQLRSEGPGGTLTSACTQGACSNTRRILHVNLWRRDAIVRPPTTVTVVADFHGRA